MKRIIFRITAAMAFAQRTREIGIRVAIGAPHSTVLSMFAAEGAQLAAIGALRTTATASGSCS